VRIVTLNVNGIRAAAGKGLFEWIGRLRADVICLQEIRARQDQLDDRPYRPRGYHCYYVDADRKGYSGVAIFSRRWPERVVEALGWPEFDPEARFIEARFSNLSVVSLYVPSGTSGDSRQALKMEFLHRLERLFRRWKRSGRQYLVCGDFNIAHKPIDLKNWRANQKNSGFLPEEREWMDMLFHRIGFVDAFRAVDSRPDCYTWWSNRGRAWEKNVGWRIDYQVATPAVGAAVRRARIYTRRRFSDHAPLIMDYAWSME
jgi:exodeoxyribonuclease-3